MDHRSAHITHDEIAGVLPRLLRPLIRLLIARGVTYPMLQRLLKTAYVRTAEADFRLADSAPTDSRISVLTGVHRRDVRELRGCDDSYDSTRTGRALLATVVRRWQTDPAFGDGKGTARALSKQTSGKPNFETLVRSVNRDIRPKTLLDELMRTGSVTQAANGMLHLRQDGPDSASGADRELVRFAQTLGDHFSATAANLEPQSSRHLDRLLCYDRLSPASLAALEADARMLAQKLLDEISARAAAAQAADRDSPHADNRYSFGLFSYHDSAAHGDMAGPDSA